METLKQPTAPGPYWWRKKEGDEWKVVDVQKLDNSLLVYRFDRPYIVFSPSLMGGEWLPIPRPEQMQEAWKGFLIKEPNGTTHD